MNLAGATPFGYMTSLLRLLARAAEYELDRFFNLGMVLGRCYCAGIVKRRRSTMILEANETATRTDP